MTTSEVCSCSQPNRHERVFVLRDVPDPITLETFDISVCTQCGLAMTTPRPADIAAYYGPRYYGRRHWITTAYCTWRRMRVLNLTLGEGRGRLLLDAGCGEGEFLEKARQHGWNVTGTEIDGRRAGVPGIRIASSLAELDATFDCISCWHVLEHLCDPVEALREMKGRLAPGGALLLSVPDAGGLQSQIFGRYWFHRDVPRHLVHFDLPSLRVTLENAGFRVVDVWHHELEYDLFGWIQSALNAILSTPNVLFDALTGHPRRTGYLPLIFSVLFATAVFPLAFGITVVSTLLRRAGTLIVAARPARD